jgi:hypothetical protein
MHLDEVLSDSTSPAGITGTSGLLRRARPGALVSEHVRRGRERIAVDRHWATAVGEIVGTCFSAKHSRAPGFATEHRCSTS